MKVASLSKHVVFNASKHAEKINEKKFYNTMCLASLPLVILAQAPESLLNVKWWITRFGKDYKDKEEEIVEYEKCYDPKFKLFPWKDWPYKDRNWEQLQKEESAELERKTAIMSMRYSHKACENMTDEDLSEWVEQFNKIQRGESGGVAQKMTTEELEKELEKRRATEEKNEEEDEEEDDEEEGEGEGEGEDGSEGGVALEGESTKAGGTPDDDKKPAAKPTNLITSEMVQNRRKTTKRAVAASALKPNLPTQSTKLRKATMEQGVAAAKAVKESQKKRAAENANNNKRSEEEVEEHIAMAREIMSAKIGTVKRRLTDIHFDWRKSDLNDWGLRLKLIEKKKIKCGEGHLQMILAELNNAV